jgi:hexokinase
MTQRSLLTANGYESLSTLETPTFDILGRQGAFDSFKHEHLPRTKYDIIVDESSNKPGEQAFEVDLARTCYLPFADGKRQKLISGRYLGEILRLVICDLIDEGVIFLGQNTYKIEIAYSFDTAFLSLMERYVLSS